MRKITLSYIRLFIHLFLFVLFVIIACSGLRSFYVKNDQKRLDIVKAAVENSAVQCYALEGSYPPDLVYLEKHYGLKLERESFIYDYKIFASNIKPEIYVFKK